MPNPPEPQRENSLDTLEDYVAAKFRRVYSRMEARGFDPVCYEARRSLARQRWLYGIGRTHSLNRKPVTWTLNSHHLPDSKGKGKAGDTISKSRGWNWPEFYVALREEAAKEGLTSLHPAEDCHLEWDG